MSTLRNDPYGFRYGRNTQGWNAQGFFSGAAPNDIYATEATVQAFAYAASSIAGVIGLYGLDGNLLAALPAAGDQFTIAQKQSDGDLKKSTVLTAGDFEVNKTLYDTPARDIKIIGYDTATALGSLNISIVGGLQEFVLSSRMTGPQANQPFPVQEGRFIVRSGTPTDYQIAAGIVSDFNSDVDYERNGDIPHAVANVHSDIVGAPATLPALSTFIYTTKSKSILVTGDVTADPLAIVGNYIIDNPSQIVQRIVKVTFDGTNSTIITDYARMVLVSAVGGSNASATKIVPIASITYATQLEMDAALIGMEVVAADIPITISVSVSEDLGDADVIQEPPGWNFGAGAAWQVASIEDECMVFDGWTTVNEAWVRDYGVPDIFIDETSATTYVQYFIESLNRIIPSAGAPQNQTLMVANLYIAAEEGSDLETNLDTLFGI